MALSADIKIYRYGSPGNSTQTANQPMASGTASVPTTVYRGSIALLRNGFVLAATSPLSTDVCLGLVEDAGPGVIDGAPGVSNTGASGAVTVDIATGSFFLAAGSGADAITQANVGASCYVINENTVGLTNGGGTRPVAGEIMGLGNNLGNVVPIAGLVAVKLGQPAGSTGGPS